jgi:hypothetical protein
LTLTAPNLQNPLQQYNPNLPPLAYRANQGFSNYASLVALARLHWHGFQGQIAYTWSHAIDNQSDPIAGDYSLEFTSPIAGAGQALYGRPTFVRQFDSNGETGSADFDQRQNLVFLAVIPLPAPAGRSWHARLLQDWQAAITGTAHSGQPFTVFAQGNDLSLFNTRADLIAPSQARVNKAVSGGVQILNPAAFQAPGMGDPGTSGRNQFAGPGVVTTSLSLSRSFALSRNHESLRLTIRADAYNFLNHANLYVPFNTPPLGTPGFGTAQYGTTGASSTFPVQAPLTETPRQIQLMLRVTF